MPWPTPNVIGLPFDARFGRWGGPDDYLYSPTQLPSLAAWFDALDTRTMLSGDGSTITDGGAVALWGDKSGNSGVNCLVLPGATGNSASVTDSVATSPSTALDVDVDYALDDYTPAAENALFGQWVAGAVAWLLTNNTTQTRFLVSFNGTSVGDDVVWTSGFADLSRQRVRATFVSDNGSGNYELKIYSSADGASWTERAVKTGTGTNSIANVASGIYVGSQSNGTSAPAAGKFYRARLRTSIAGATVLDIDFSTAGKKLANGDTFVCATGQTVTLNSSGATGARIAGERDLYQGTLANRPVYLQYAGTKYGWNNATNANTFTTPDSAAVSITGDIDIRCRLALTAWTTGSASQDIVTRWETSNQSYLFRVNSTGTLRFITTADGSTAVNAQSTAAVSFAANEAGWIRVTRDVDNGAGGNTTRFYTSSDGETWAQLGDPVVVASTTSIFDGTAVLRISGNALATDTGINGKIYRAQIYDGIGGTLKADFNPALYTSGTTFTASTGEVWTINGGAHIVTRTGLYFDGSNDYLKTAAFSLGQPETVYVAGEQSSWVINDRIFAGGAADVMDMYQPTTTPRIGLYAGGFGPAIDTFVLKTCALVYAVFSGASSVIGRNRETASAGDAGTAAGNGFTLGSNGTGAGAYGNQVISETAIYAANHAQATRNRWALYSGRRHGFAV